MYKMLAADEINITGVSSLNKLKTDVNNNIHLLYTVVWLGKVNHCV